MKTFLFKTCVFVGTHELDNLPAIWHQKSSMIKSVDEYGEKIIHRTKKYGFGDISVMSYILEQNNETSRPT